MYMLMIWVAMIYLSYKFAFLNIKQIEESERE